jgi:tetratricopeptide (TPR) repeat protein
MCDALVELGRYEEAVTVAQRLNDLKPGVPAWIRTARLRFLHNDLEGAIELLGKAANSSGERGEAAAWTWLELARLHLHAGATSAAGLALDAARRAYPELPAILPVRASLKLAQGDARGALDLYRQALALQPNAEDALAAWRLARQSGQDGFTKHQAALLEGLAKLDSAALSRRALAEYFSDSGQSGRALELARQELAARPDLYSHATLARALAGAGDRTGAQQHARQAMALNTPDPRLQADMAAILRAPALAREARP